MKHQLSIAAVLVMLFAQLTAYADTTTSPLPEPDPPDTVWTRDFQAAFIHDIGFSHNGSFIACRGKAMEFLLIGTAQGNLIHQTPMTTEVVALAISPDDNILAVAGEDEKIYLWNVNSGELIRTLEHHKVEEFVRIITDLDFSPDGQFLISSGSDSVIVWNVAKGSRLFSYTDEQQENFFRRSATFIGQHQFAYTNEDSLTFISLPIGAVQKRISTSSLWDIQYSAATGAIAARAGAYQVVLVDTSATVRTVYSSSIELRAYTTTPEGRYIITSNLDGYLQTWNAVTGELIRTTGMPNQWGSYVPYDCIGISPDSLYMVTALSGWVSLWHTPWSTASGIITSGGGTPAASLFAPYPVPGSDEVVLKYSLPTSGAVLLEVCDSQGRRVAVLVDEHRASGDYEVTFRTSEYHLATGMYYCRLITNNTTISTQALPITK